MQHYPSKDIPSLEELEKKKERIPNLDPLSTLAFIHVLRTGDEAYRGVCRPFKENNLSQGRFMLMMQLIDRESNELKELSPAEMAEGASVARATITGLVDGLLKDGLVERKPDPHDRRRYLIRLSEAGHNLIKKLLPIHFQNIRTFMDVLDKEEKENLIGLLTKILDRIQEVEPSDGTPGSFCSL